MHFKPGAWFDRLSPAQRFLLGSLVVLGLGMLSIGAWVSRQIEDGVVHRTASTTALYVDSLIASRIQDLASANVLSPDSIDQLDWLLEDTPLGKEIAVFQVWDRDGQIVYSTAPELVGKIFPIESHLAESLAGAVSADVGDVEGEDNLPAGAPGQDLIEIYSPVRDRETGAVIAAAEFYYATDDLKQELAIAQRQSWLVVGGVTAIVYVLLATFVRGASNTIQHQQQVLAGQVTRLTTLLQENEELNSRVRGAAARTTALNERFLRRFSAELHDGPAQEISLALLRLDTVAARLGEEGQGNHQQAETDNDLEVIQASLRRSLQEVRATSSGLLLPQLRSLTVAQTVEHVVRGRQRRTGATPAMTLERVPAQASLATKIALYRVIQESLNNAWRHAPKAAVAIAVTGDDAALTVTIADDGPGFDAAAVGRDEDQLGIVGMRERVMSLGGAFRIETGPGQGVRVIASIPHAAQEDIHA